MFEKIRAFESGWKSSEVVIPEFLTEEKLMRKWQEECHNGFFESSYENFIINAPTGSGKSLAICFIENSVLKRDKNTKVIISVPQLIIANGFKGIYKLQYPNGEINEWYVDDYDLCNDESSEESNSDILISFLSKNNSARNTDRILVCSHSTMCKAFNKLKRQHKTHLLKDLFLCVDEAHHTMIFDDEKDQSNELGKIVSYFCKNGKEDNLQIGLITATMFRGDKLPIIPQKYLGSFFKYSLPYDKYFEDLRYLKSFTYDFVLHKEHWFAPLKKLFNEKIGKTIVFIPHPSSKHSSGDKYFEVKEILWAIAGGKDKKYFEDENTGVITIRKNGCDIIVVDLVDEGKQKEGKKFILENPEKVDVIINVKMFAEGADWQQADREIIIGSRNSLNQLMQMIGRIFRDHPDKDGKPVEIIQVLPNVSEKDLKKDKFKDQLDCFMNSVYASLLMELIINPIDIYIPTTNSNEGKESKPNEAKEYLIETLGDTQYSTLYNKIIGSLTEFRTNNPNIEDVESLDKAYKSIIIEALKRENVKKYNEEISTMFLNVFKRRSKSFSVNIKKLLKGIDISKIDFHNVFEKDPLSFLLYYGSYCGVETYKAFRDAIKSTKTLEEHIRDAERLSELYMSNKLNIKYEGD